MDNKHRYRAVLEHKDPALATLEKRQGTIHLDYTYAASRKQATRFIENKNPNYNIVTLLED